MAFLPNSVYVYFEIIEIICPVNNMNAQGKRRLQAALFCSNEIHPCSSRHVWFILQLIKLPLVKRII